MDGLFSGNSEFQSRGFVTVDARQNAFIDWQQPLTRVSGLTGAMPAMMLESAERPRGFGQVVLPVGLGGTPSPIANGVADPLITRAQFNEQFMAGFVSLDPGA